MLYTICSIFLLNLNHTEVKQQKKNYLENLSSIEKTTHYQENISYKKAPHLITKNYKISN